MKQKTFLLIVAIVVVLMAGFFTVQLTSLGAKWCIPEFTWECEIEGVVACEGELMGAELVNSECIGTTCRGNWLFHCDEGTDTTYEGPVNCDDEMNPGCEGN
jgi:hypothetical protein